MESLEEKVQQIQETYGIIGRSEEIEKILIAYYSKKNILIEGEIGTSKTTLAHAFASFMDKEFFRIDGSEDVLSHVLVGYFDPPLVISKGYSEDAFLFGPLAKSMRNGGVLFINELNRLPESTQNVLLSALDEGYLDVPKLPSIKSKKGFITITTMNPSAHVGVTNLGEALKDRFVWINMDYQTEEEEIEIIKSKLEKLIQEQDFEKKDDRITEIAQVAARIVQLSRDHKSLRRGASIRAGIDLASLVYTYYDNANGAYADKRFWYTAAHMSLSTKIEIEDGSDSNIAEVINELVEMALKDFI